mgnify:CR=1 FL=1
MAKIPMRNFWKGNIISEFYELYYKIVGTFGEDENSNNNLYIIEGPEITYIGQYGFNSCSNAVIIKMPKLVEIGLYGFSGCSKVKQLITDLQFLPHATNWFSSASIRWKSTTAASIKSWPLPPGMSWCSTSSCSAAAAGWRSCWGSHRQSNKQNAQVTAVFPVHFSYYPKDTFSKKYPWDHFFMVLNTV